MEVEVAAPKLGFEQRKRAVLIAESRGIDDDTAFELVYLRDALHHARQACDNCPICMEKLNGNVEANSSVG